MNVYDFDRTIYRGDSTLDFFCFILKRHPSVMLDLPAQLSAYMNYKANRTDKTAFKEAFFRFLGRIPDIDFEISRFWERNEKRINGWYYNRKEPDDVIISASPEFLLVKIQHRLGAGYLIATRVDKHTGRFIGKNCYGDEKLERFREVFGNGAVINEFYSDSHSDEALARLAGKAYFVRNGKPERWQFNEGC